MEKLTIIKVGGKIVEEASSLQALIEEFAAIEGRKILVHGGGRTATALSARLGIESKMVNGRRITDKETLEVVTMVYGGLVNKNIVAKLQAAGVEAIGMTGADCNIILSSKRPVTEIDYGFVGDVKHVASDKISNFLQMGIVPVVAPLTHDGKGNMLNTNADTMAAALATVLASDYETTLTFCFEKPGVLFDANDDSSVIPTMNKQDFQVYVEKGIISEGMIPKIENALKAVDAGVKRVVITSPFQLQGGTEIM